MKRDAIDLRSDTVTRPTPGMRAAMASAEVGDDVFNEDPTVLALQERVAELLGKEAAVFAPSGSMSNQIGVRIHCKAGDEFLCEAGCHIFNYEQGAFAQLSGVVAHPVVGRGGVLHVEQLQGLVRGDNEHLVRTRMVCLENTHNRGGGRVLPLDNVAEICEWAHSRGLRTHLDGARLMNAVVATGVSADRWAAHFDTVSVCFSKGLGAPVGSALAGTRDAMREARRHRKLFGGGMRQAGVIAAAALYALEHHVERLAEDHEHAKVLADAIRTLEGLRLTHEPVETNIVNFDVETALGAAADLAARLEARGVRILPLGPRSMRAVTHLDVTRDDVLRAGDVLRDVVESSAAAARN